MKVLETKYKSQIKDMLDNHQGLQNELTAKNKRLEEENKKQKEHLVVGGREQELEIMQLRAKVDEMANQEACLRNEVQEMRAEQDRKASEF